MKKTLIVYSGGMDSYTVLQRAREEGHLAGALSFNYGQRHDKELEVAAKVCARYGIPHMVVDITSINVLLQGSSLTSGIEVPEGHYEEESMKSTVVPNRNMILISLAIGYAVSQGYDAVGFGAHSGDHAIYPDCRPEFVRQMDTLAQIANWEPVTLWTPFIHSDKTGILKWGLNHGLDYSETWTCYNGREDACGKCGSCQERLESFEQLGESDPIAYEVNDESNK